MRLRLQTLATLLLVAVLPLCAEKVRVGFYQDAGWSELSKTGERIGIMPDWIARVAPFNDWEIEWVNCAWGQGLERLAKGEIDLMIAAIYRSSRRERWIYPHIPFLPFRSYLFVRSDGPLAANTKTLEGTRIGVPEGYVHAEILKTWLDRKGISCRLISYRSMPELERALADGKVDVVLGSATRELVTQSVYLAMPSLPLYVVVNSRRPEFAEAVDRAMTIINDVDPNYMRGLAAKHLPWCENITPLHDVSHDRELSAATSAVLAEGAAFAAENDLRTVVGNAALNEGPYVVAIVFLLVLGVAAQIRLVRALAAAKAGAKAKASFLATMSHEIRTPLNAVVGFTELLDEDALTPTARREYLNGIKFASGTLVSLIDDVLDLSRLEAGRMNVLEGSFDSNRLIAEMESIFSFRTAEKGIDLQCSTTERLPLLALRESCVRQMLLNLIGNAVKFTDKGGIHCRVAAVPDGRDTVTYLVVVRDSGCGIPAEKLATLFDPFVRAADSTRDRVYKGTGLGLAIVKRLVDAAHGSVEVRSEVGRGTSFAVRIPHVRTLGPAPSPGGEARPKPVKRPMGPESLSFLLVDDIALNLRVLSLHLKNLGAGDVRVAASAAEALNLLRDRPADVVFTDLWMPEFSGEQLARTIHADAALQGTRVFAVTADADAGATFDVKVFDGIVTKPVTAAKLRPVIGCASDV